jgi:hypothetical protein
MIKLFKEKYGYDPRELEDPSSDEKWLQFRCDQITEVANEIAEVVHSYGKVMAASPFPTPAMSRKMVRQDWGKWNLDIVFPMVYHNFYTGDVSFISDCMIEDVRDKNPMTTLYCGMSGSNSPLMFECMDSALNNGAEGISIFTVSSLRSPEIREKFKAYADSARASRAASKASLEVSVPKVVNANPFENAGIMNAANMHMLAYLSKAKASFLPELKNVDQANFNLSGYRLISEYGATKYYQVSEQNSKVVFDVTFYFYGGIISGWSVEPEKVSYKKYKDGLAYPSS